jgi:hypothetical protein
VLEFVGTKELSMLSVCCLCEHEDDLAKGVVYAVMLENSAPIEARDWLR